MKRNKLAKQLALLSAATWVSITAQNVLAHTGIRDVVPEGVVAYNAFNVSHGCDGNGDSSVGRTKNIIAMSALFPNAADPALAVVTKLDPTTGAPMGTLADLSDDIAGVVAGVGFTGLGLNTIQPNLFANFVPKIDKNTLLGAHATPLKRGYFTNNGPLPYASAPIFQEVTSSAAFSPFAVGPINFKTTSCAKSLKVRIAEVNYCLSGKASRKNPARADVWIGHLTTKFNDANVMPYSQAEMESGLVYWPTMTVARDLVKNPLDPACGAGYNLAIEPADADIDANLPIPYNEGKGGARQLYWPTSN